MCPSIIKVVSGVVFGGLCNFETLAWKKDFTSTYSYSFGHLSRHLIPLAWLRYVKQWEIHPPLSIEAILITTLISPTFSFPFFFLPISLFICGILNIMQDIWIFKLILSRNVHKKCNGDGHCIALMDSKTLSLWLGTTFLFWKWHITRSFRQFYNIIMSFNKVGTAYLARGGTSGPCPPPSMWCLF